MALITIPSDDPFVLSDRSSVGEQYPGVLKGQGWVLINESILTSFGLLTITEIPSGFDILMLTVALRSNDSATTDTLTMNINGLSSGSSHEYSTLSVYGTTESVQGGDTTDDWRIDITADSAPAGYISYLNFYFFNYDGAIGSHFRHALWTGSLHHADTSGGSRSISGGGFVETSNPITSISLDVVNGSGFVTNSMYKLYGM